ncbi:MAG: hypothetical protein Q7S80_02505 [bacterium]|nr:hypothetical protein [bacterium]
MRTLRLLPVLLMAGTIAGLVCWSIVVTVSDQIWPPDLVVKDDFGNEWKYDKDVLTTAASAGTVLGPFQGPVHLRASRRYFTEIWVPHLGENLGVSVWHQKPDCQLGKREWAKLIGRDEATYRVRLRNLASSDELNPSLLLRIEIWPPTDAAGSET